MKRGVHVHRRVDANISSKPGINWTSKLKPSRVRFLMLRERRHKCGKKTRKKSRCQVEIGGMCECMTLMLNGIGDKEHAWRCVFIHAYNPQALPTESACSITQNTSNTHILGLLVWFSTNSSLVFLEKGCQSWSKEVCKILLCQKSRNCSENNDEEMSNPQSKPAWRSWHWPNQG
jgi:hypothetical protein